MTSCYGLEDCLELHKWDGRLALSFWVGVFRYMFELHRWDGRVAVFLVGVIRYSLGSGMTKGGMTLCYELGRYIFY